MGKLLLPEGQFSVYVHRQAEKEFLLLSKPFLLCLSPILNPGLSCLLVLNPGIFLPSASCTHSCQECWPMLFHGVKTQNYFSSSCV